MGQQDDGNLPVRVSARRGRRLRGNERGKRGIEPERRQDRDATGIDSGLCDQLRQADAREIAVREEQRIDEEPRRLEAPQRVRDRGRALDESETDLGGDLAPGEFGGEPFDAGIVRVAAALAVGGEQDAAMVKPSQWLVPSEKLILFQTLYLPEGRDIGMRLTSANVAAS
jgi:hypothetical protein